jgi:hypothetical protein
LPAFSVLFSEAISAAEDSSSDAQRAATDRVLPADAARHDDRNERVSSMRSRGASHASQQRADRVDDGMVVLVRHGGPPSHTADSVSQSRAAAAVGAAGDDGTGRSSGVLGRGSVASVANAFAELFGGAPDTARRRSGHGVGSTSKAGARAVSGLPGQIFRQVSAIFVDMVRRNHVLFSVFAAPQDALLHLGVPERVMVLAAILFTSMCVSAMVCGRRPDAVQSRVITGLLAAVCMVPCRMLIPHLYRTATQLPAWRIERYVAAAQQGSRGDGVADSWSAASARRRRQQRSRLGQQVRALCCCCDARGDWEGESRRRARARSDARTRDAGAGRRLSAVLPQVMGTRADGVLSPPRSQRPDIVQVGGIGGESGAGSAGVVASASSGSGGGITETHTVAGGNVGQRRRWMDSLLQASDGGQSNSLRSLPLGTGTLQRKPSSGDDAHWGGGDGHGSADSNITHRDDGAVGNCDGVGAVVSLREQPVAVASSKEAVAHSSVVQGGVAARSEPHRVSLDAVDVRFGVREYTDVPIAPPSRRGTCTLFLTNAERVLVASSLEVTDELEAVHAGEDAPLMAVSSAADDGSAGRGRSAATRSSGAGVQRDAVARDGSIAVQRCVFNPRPMPVFVALFNAQMLVGMRLWCGLTMRCLVKLYDAPHS